MMDVQLMRQIVDDVERGVLPAVAREAALRWCAPEEVGSLTYLRTSANYLFRLQVAGQPCYLRLAHANARRRSAIEAELDFVRHVSRSGLAVALPLESTRDLLIEELSSGEQRFWAVVFEGLPGHERELDELDEAGYQAWGRALALVHNASQTFPPRPARPIWRDELRAMLGALPADETTVARILTSGLSWLDSLTSSDQDYGLLHGDFELDNLIWDGEQFQALDFDDAAYGWYAVDFAAALQDVWLGDDVDSATRTAHVAWFVQGYAALRPLPDGMLQALPRLLTLIEASKVARMLQAYATTTDAETPEWVADMRAAHQRWFTAKRATLEGFNWDEA